MKHLTSLLAALIVALSPAIALAQSAASTFTPLGNTCVLFDSRTLPQSESAEEHGDWRNRANDPVEPIALLPEELAVSQPVYFAARGACGIPESAVAAHLNIIPVNNAGYGAARVFDGGTTGTNTYPLLWWSPNEGTRVSAPVILCQPTLECFGSDLGVSVAGTGSADIVIVAEGFYSPVLPAAPQTN